MMKDHYSTHLYTENLRLKSFLCRELYILFYIKNLCNQLRFRWFN